MLQFHIDEVFPKGKVYPMIIHFRNGYVTENFKANDCILFEDENTGQKIIAAEICDLIYAGNEVQEDLGKTFILARNVVTGKVRLIEAGHAELQPVLTANIATTDSEVKYTSDELTRNFGSKKYKQIIKHREKLKVNVQTVTEQMQNVTNCITEDLLDLSSYNTIDSDQFYIPTINRKAIKVEKVYDVDNILTDEQIKKIYSEINVTKEYMRDLSPFLKTIIKKNMSQIHTVLFVYANTLLQLYATLMKDIGKKNFIACKYSVTLNDIVMKNFLSNDYGRRGRSQRYKDKSLCHALIILLLINNYKFDLDELCRQLKLTCRTLTAKVALTGATVVKDGKKKLVQLKLPLNRPALRRKSSKF